MSESQRVPFGQGTTTSTNPVTEQVEKLRRKIGALWTRFSQEVGNEEYYTGELTLTKELEEAFHTGQTNNYGEKVVPVVIFKNRRKETDKQPDYRILIGKQRNS